MSRCETKGKKVCGYGETFCTKARKEKRKFLKTVGMGRGVVSCEKN